MAVMRNMLIQYGHLTTTDTRTNITHTIIVTDLFHAGNEGKVHEPA